MSDDKKNPNGNSFTTATTVISLRRLTSAASERWVRSDGEEQDIGFAGDHPGAGIDIAALAVFLDGGLGRPVVSYDQSGNGNHLRRDKA